jgi:hypothetical protein
VERNPKCDHKSAWAALIVAEQFISMATVSTIAFFCCRRAYIYSATLALIFQSTAANNNTENSLRNSCMNSRINSGCQVCATIEQSHAEFKPKSGFKF